MIECGNRGRKRSNPRKNSVASSTSSNPGCQKPKKFVIFSNEYEEKKFKLANPSQTYYKFVEDL